MKYKNKNIVVMLLLSAAVIFTSCDATKNEGEVVDTFFGEASSTAKLRDYNAYTKSRQQYFYSAVLRAESKDRPWQEFDNTYGSGYYSSQSYKVTSKNAHDHWVNSKLTAVDLPRDFQIEMLFSLSDPPYGEVVGGLKYLAGKKTGYTIYSSRNKQNSHEIRIVNLEDNKVIHTFDTGSEQRPSTVLLTIRKVGNTVAFFYQRKHLMSRKFTSSADLEVAYTISEKTSMVIYDLGIAYLLD